MPKTLPFIFYFLICLIVLTIAMGIVGMIAVQTKQFIILQIISMLALLPYLLSFFLMTQRFIKKTQQLPNPMQRWKLSIGCTTAFWIYLIVASLLGIFLAQGKIDFAAIQYAFRSREFLILFLGSFSLLNAFLVLLGYWFLGKPAEKMLAYYQKS